MNRDIGLPVICNRDINCYSAISQWEMINYDEFIYSCSGHIIISEQQLIHIFGISELHLVVAECHTLLLIEEFSNLPVILFYLSVTF